MPGIFVSYRRKDAAGHAGRLFDRLRDHFGKDCVFRDVDRLKAGEDFVEALARAVDSCDVFILVIGRDWVDARNERGQRRLDDPHDFIRLEVETALRRKVLVLPVLVEGASMPEPSELPETLSLLSRRQAIELSEHRWDFDVQELLRTIEEAGGGKRRGRTRVAVWAIAGLAVLALAGTATSRIWWPWLNGARPSADSPSAAISTPPQPAGESPAPRVPPVNKSESSPPAPSPKGQSEPAATRHEQPPGQPSPENAKPPEPPSKAAAAEEKKATPPVQPPPETVKPPEVTPDVPPKKAALPAPVAVQVSVPKLLGQPARSAADDLGKLGFRWKMEGSSRGRGEPGTVFAQRPPAESMAEPGTVISLYVVVPLEPNEHAAGSTYLSPGRPFDLDGDDRMTDVSLERTNDQFVLSFLGGAQGALVPTTRGGKKPLLDAASCEGARLSPAPVPASEQTAGQQVCVRTTAGRPAAIFLGRLTPDPPELFIRYSTLETTRSEPPRPTVNPAPAKPPYFPRNPSPPAESCAQAVQGKIAWDYSGNRTWASANVERLCRGATDDQPARCFDRVMHGGVNQGGGTRWEWPDALDLCEGTKNATETIACFQRYISMRRPMQDAIAACDERSLARKR